MKNSILITPIDCEICGKTWFCGVSELKKNKYICSSMSNGKESCVPKGEKKCHMKKK